MEKLTKYARIADKALSVIRVILLVAAAISLVALALGIGLASPLVDYIHRSPDNFWTLTSGVIQLKLTGAVLVLTTGGVRSMLASFLLVLAMLLAISLRLIHHLKGLMAEMQDGRPFTPKSTSSVRRIGGLIIVYAFVTPIASMIPSLFMMNTLQLPAGIQLNPQYAVNGLALVAGLLTLLLSLVFDYGAQLQRQSDETL